MLTYKDKLDIVSTYNQTHKTFYRYNVKNDTVIEDFNRKSFPTSFDNWYTRTK